VTFFSYDLKPISINMKKNNSKFYGVFYHVLIFPGVEIALILIEKLFLFKSMVEHRNV